MLPDCGQLPSWLPSPAIVNHQALPVLPNEGLACPSRSPQAGGETACGLVFSADSVWAGVAFRQLLLSFQGELLCSSVCIRNVSEQSSAGAVLPLLTVLIWTSPRAFVRLFVPVCVLGMLRFSDLAVTASPAYSRLRYQGSSC